MPNVKMNRTEYQGLVITQDQYEELKQQPAAEVLRFVPAGNKYVMQAKLPEMGMYDPEIYGDKPGLNGKPYHIRTNMNYLARAMMRYVMDENGGIDAKKREELGNYVYRLSIMADGPEAEKSSASSQILWTFRRISRLSLNSSCGRTVSPA